MVRSLRRDGEVRQVGFMTMKSPIETKVIAATAGSGAGAVVSSFVVWLLGVLVWHASATAGHVADASSAVPGPVSSLIHVVISFAGAFAGGYLAPHTKRYVAGAPLFNTIGSPDLGHVTLAVPPRQVMVPNDSGPDVPGATDVEIENTAVTGVGA